MAVPQNGEIGHCVQFKEIGTGYAEKISYHKVCGPGGQEVRQAVENIEGLPSGLRDDIMDSESEGFESGISVENMDCHSSITGFQERLMGCEPYVMQCPAIGVGPFHKGKNEVTVIGDSVHLPDNIVTGIQAVYDPVESRESGADLKIVLHDEISGDQGRWTFFSSRAFTGGSPATDPSSMALRTAPPPVKI
jgi:hypothetical protein